MPACCLWDVVATAGIQTYGKESGLRVLTGVLIKEFFYMVRLLVLAAVGFILYKLVTNEMRKRTEKKSANEAATEKRKAASGDMVKDPICGAYVNVESSVSVRDGDTVHRFCSYECRDAFLQQLRGEGREIPERNSSSDES